MATVSADRDATIGLPMVLTRAGGTTSIVRVRAEGRDAVIFELEQPGGAGRIRATIGPIGPRAVLVGRHVGLRYEAQRTDLDAVYRRELAALFEAFVRMGDAFLDMHPEGPLSACLERWRSPLRRLDFTPAGLLALLGIAPGAELPGGHRLDAVFPSSLRAEGTDDRMRLDVALEHPTHGTLLLQIGPASDQHALGRSHHFSVSYLTRGKTLSPEARAAAAFVALLLELRDPPDLEVSFPASTADLAELSRQLPAPPADDEVLNLALDAECGQACSFCSVTRISAPWSDTDADTRLDAILGTLRSHAERGVKRVRLNGYDPLAYPRILEVAAEMRRLGYERVDAFSPCTRLADDALLDALLSALPAGVWFYVPVYGCTAAIHDRVVGRAGAFDRVCAALDRLVERVPRERILACAVVVRDNVEALGELRSWLARRYAIELRAQTPYPSSESPHDAFRTSVERFERIVAVAASCDPPLHVHGVPPCVAWRGAIAAGRAPERSIRCTAEPPRVPGREYLSKRIRHRALRVQHSAFVAAAVACPHQHKCALKPACAGEVLAGYAEVYGLSELQPVGLAELLGCTPLPADDSARG